MYRRLISIAMELFPLPGLTAEFANGSPSLVKENLKVSIHGRAPSLSLLNGGSMHEDKPALSF